MVVSVLFMQKGVVTGRSHSKVVVQMANGLVQIAHGTVQIAHGSVQIAHGSILCVSLKPFCGASLQMYLKE